MKIQKMFKNNHAFVPGVVVPVGVGPGVVVPGVGPGVIVPGVSGPGEEDDSPGTLDQQVADDLPEPVVVGRRGNLHSSTRQALYTG